MTPAVTPGTLALGDAEFVRLQALIYGLVGINLTPAKKSMICGRLSRRLRHYQFDDFGPYLDLIESAHGADERQIAVDLLTTNETHFFREPKHFQFLADRVLATRQTPFRIWSAACSTGEEPYTLAMVLAERWGLTADWAVLGTDISTRVLARARTGLYPMDRVGEIPSELLQRYCLKGVRSHEGEFRIASELRAKVRFEGLNLVAPLPWRATFDVIFLRNVMIYFDLPTRRKVVDQLSTCLKRGGYFMVGHSESLNGLTDRLKSVAPAVYQAP